MKSGTLFSALMVLPEQPSFTHYVLATFSASSKKPGYRFYAWLMHKSMPTRALNTAERRTQLLNTLTQQLHLLKQQAVVRSKAQDRCLPDSEIFELLGYSAQHELNIYVPYGTSKRDVHKVIGGWTTNIGVGFMSTTIVHWAKEQIDTIQW